MGRTNHVIDRNTTTAHPKYSIYICMYLLMASSPMARVARPRTFREKNLTHTQSLTLFRHNTFAFSTVIPPFQQHPSHHPSVPLVVSFSSSYLLHPIHILF